MNITAVIHLFYRRLINMRRELEICKILNQNKRMPWLRFSYRNFWGNYHKNFFWINDNFSNYSKLVVSLIKPTSIMVLPVKLGKMIKVLEWWTSFLTYWCIYTLFFIIKSSLRDTGPQNGKKKEKKLRQPRLSSKYDVSF